MNEDNKYTQEEIQSKVNILQSEVDKIKLHRKSLLESMKSKKEQIEYWETLDKSQMKLF